MGTKSIRKNFLYNLIYQVLIIILPIITTPYISRVLGAEGVGIYSFTVSIVTYFTLFGTLGVAMYGQREIAYARDNVSKRKRVFWEIIFFRFITMTISMLVFILTYATHDVYKQYFQILILYLLAFAFDISWFFQGMEEFKKTVIRNVAVRTISVACIFIFVKNTADLTKYILIYSLADLIGNISLWFYLPKYFKGIKIKHINIKRHMIPIILLFIPQIAAKLYNIVDKTMIGYMITDKAALGNYEEAYKVINVLFTVVSSLGIVMIPRIASIFASGDKIKLNEYILKSFRFTFFLAFPMMFGLMAVSNEFIPLFLGEEYKDAIIIANILAPTILGMGITNVIGTQYLLPTKQQKYYTYSIIIGLGLNIVFNWVLINTNGAFGASVATTTSQFVVALVQMHFVKKQIDLRKAAQSGKKYLIASLTMFAVCFVIGIFIKQPVASVVVKVIAGFVTYGLMLIILGDKYVYEIRDMIRSKLNRRKQEQR